MSVRRHFGIDGFDLTVHCAVTVAAMIVFGPVMELPPVAALVGVPTTSLAVLSWRRGKGLASLPPEPTGEVAAERVFELEERVAELEAAQQRMADIEERLDFAERLLAQPRPAGSLRDGFRE